MSRFDTSQFEASRQGGAQLGTQQFGMLADLANRREQNRMDQEALQQRAQQIQFGQSMDVQQMDLARQRFGLDQQQESRLNEAFRMEMDQYAAQVQQAEVKKAQELQTAHAYGRVLIEDLKRTSQPQQPTGQRQDMESMGFTPPKNPIGDALQQMPGGGAEDPADAIDRRDLERMISLASIDGNMEALTYLSKGVDSAAERASLLQKTKWAIQAAKDPNLIADPKMRAAALYLVKAGDTDAVSRLLDYQTRTNEKIRAENAKAKQGVAGTVDAKGVAGIYEKLAADAMRRTSLTSSIKPEQRSQHARLMEAAATARTNPSAILPGGRVVMDGGKPGRDGGIRIANPDGSEDSVSPATFAAMVAPAMLGGGESAPAGDGVPDLSQDFDTVLDRILAETPNATPEQVAAEMERRGFVME